MEQENNYQEAPKKKSPFDALIPRKGYFFTPILLDINILIFAVMCLTGVSPVTPTADDLLRWGANHRPETLGGEPWRLFTSMFLHFGIFHLAFNMYALFSLGVTLEPFIGKWRFLVLYLLAGLGGSAVSLWWHDDFSVSAGASGAIFGVFGVLGALLTTNLIDPSVRGEMLRGVGISIALNLAIGLSGGIDNSAHIGGLLTGALGGYLIYFDLRAWYERRIARYTGLIVATAATAAVIVLFWMWTLQKADLPAYQDEVKFRGYMEQLGELEHGVFEFREKNPVISDDQFRQRVIEPWKRGLAICDAMLDLELSPAREQLVETYQLYFQLRLEAAQHEYNYHASPGNEKEDSLNAVTRSREADSVVGEINKLIKALD